MRRAVVGVITIAVLTSPFVEGQGTPGRGRRVTFETGAVAMSQRDEHASPLRYNGVTPSVDVEYATETERRRVAVRLGGAMGALGAALTGSNDLPRQETWRGWIEVEYARWLDASPSATQWLLGVRLAERGTVIRHVNAQNDAAGYLFFSTAVGPVFGVRRAVGRQAILTASLAAPALALIARPYLRAVPELPAGAVRLRLAGPAEFQCGSLRAAYSLAVGNRTNIVVGYRLFVERYRDVEPFRSASQALSLGVALRAGGQP